MFLLCLPFHIKGKLCNDQGRVSVFKMSFWKLHGQWKEAKLGSNHVYCMRAQSYPTLFDPMDCSPPISSVHGILQARILEWVAISFSRGSSLPRDWTHISCISCIACGFFTTRAMGEVQSWPISISLGYLTCQPLVSSSVKYEYYYSVIKLLYWMNQNYIIDLTIFTTTE